MKPQTYRKKGFLSAVILILMFSMLSVVLLLVFRSMNDASLAKYTKDSAKTYQVADKETELILQKVRMLDDEAATIPGSKRIPENTSANLSGTDGVFHCTTGTALGDVQCFPFDNAVTLNDESLAAMTSADVASKKVSDVAYISVDGTSTITARSLRVPVPERIANQISGLKVTDSSGDAALGVSSVACSSDNGGGPFPGVNGLSWKETRSRSASDNDNFLDTVDKFSLRYKIVDNSSSDKGLLSDATDGWKSDALLSNSANNIDIDIDTTSPDNIASNQDNAQKFSLKNFLETRVGPGKTVYLIMKEKNKKPFRLDSLYTSKIDGSDTVARVKIVCN